MKCHTISLEATRLVLTILCHWLGCFVEKLGLNYSTSAIAEPAQEGGLLFTFALSR